jgi:hypothetical protein
MSPVDQIPMSLDSQEEKAERGGNPAERFCHRIV